MDLNNLEPNSHKYRQSGLEKSGPLAKKDIPPKEKLEKVISGTAKLKRKSLWKRFAELFLAGSVKDVKTYLFMDVFIPAVKDTIDDLLTKGVHMMLYGEAPKKKTNTINGGGYVAYGSAFRSGEKKERLPSAQNRMAHRFDDIVLDSKGDAEQVLDVLQELIERYGQATVEDLYDLMEITITWADDADQWGWTDIRSAYTSRTKDGYVLNMPKCIKL